MCQEGLLTQREKGKTTTILIDIKSVENVALLLDADIIRPRCLWSDAQKLVAAIVQKRSWPLAKGGDATYETRYQTCI
jgi:hypothetical protein